MKPGGFEYRKTLVVPICAKFLMERNLTIIVSKSWLVHHVLAVIVGILSLHIGHNNVTKFKEMEIGNIL